MKTASRTKFFIEFYSTCLEGEDRVGGSKEGRVLGGSGVVTRGLVGVLRDLLGFPGGLVWVLEDSVRFLGCLVGSWRAWRGFLGFWGASSGPRGA